MLYFVTDEELEESADAIRAKTGSASSVPWVSGTGFKAAIGDIPSGGGGWIKDDKNTYLHINIYSDIYLTVYLFFGQTVASGNTIDWGDNASPVTPTHTGRALVSHTYSEKGEYVIKLTNSSGYFYFADSSTTRGYIFQDGVNNSSNAKYHHFTSILRRVELGKGWKCDEGRQFESCTSLSSVYISVAPSQTSLGSSVFGGCLSLSDFSYADKALNGITSLSTYVFNGCVSLPKAIFPPNITSIPNYYHQLNSSTYGALCEIDIPSGVTSIGTNAFAYCRNVAEIVIPEDVSSIAANAFTSCYGVHVIRLKPTTPPTLSNSNAFTLNTQTYNPLIIVPHGTLSDYQTASNWASYASYMQEEPQ